MEIVTTLLADLLTSLCYVLNYLYLQIVSNLFVYVVIVDYVLTCMFMPMRSAGECRDIPSLTRLRSGSPGRCSRSHQFRLKPRSRLAKHRNGFRSARLSRNGKLPRILAAFRFETGPSICPIGNTCM